MGDKFYWERYQAERATRIKFGEYGTTPDTYPRMEILLPNCPECGKQIIQDNNEILCKSCGLCFSEYDIYGILERAISLKTAKTQ